MKTHILFVLDKSGSMGVRQLETISGFNEYLNDLKNDENLKNARFTLTLFDTSFTDVCVNEKLDNVEELVSHIYAPSGMTALYDAIAHVLTETEDKVKDKHRALVVILTDGEENSSKEHTRQQIFDMIKRYEDKGNYTFVFLGCDQDAYAEGAKMGVNMAANSLNYDSKNIKVAYRNLSVGTLSYAGGQSASVDTFWDDVDKQ